MDMRWITTNLWDPLKPFWDQLATYMPKVVVALFVLLIGWIVALLLSRLVAKFFKLIKLDYWAGKLQIDAFLSDGGIKLNTMQLVEKTIYWILMFCVILLALNALELRGADEVFQRVTGYVPKVIFAIVILVVGAFVGRISQGAVLAYLKNVGVASAELVAKIAQYAIIVTSVVIAVEKLDVSQVVVNLFQTAFIALCVAFALAFGLGGKEWAAGIINRWSQRK